jgi:hypothetical protein
MNGEVVFSNGIYHVYAGTYRAPSDTLTADEIVGPISMRRSRPASERVNTMKASYVDREKNWEPTETLPKTIAAYVARDDGDVLEENLDLPFTSNWYEAQRLVQKKLTESNQERSLSIPCSLKAARFMAGDRINFEFPERGWSPKIFKVLGWRLNWRDSLTITLDLIEDDAAAYADPVEGDYNTRSIGGEIVEVSPEPIPGIDSIPRTGLGHYGEGSWNLELFPNSLSGSPNDGEIYITSGDYLLPDGTIRSYTNQTVNTPYESATTPPDGVFYLVSGVSGFFVAIYDRTRESWYVVDNSNNEVLRNGTGALSANDYVVARGVKTSASGGIDSLTSLITFVEDPRATAGATLGTDVFNEAGAVLSDIDVRNDQLVANALGAENENATFEIPRVGPTGLPAPASWYGYGSAVAAGFVGGIPGAILIPANAGLQYSSAVFTPQQNTEYEIVTLARKTNGADVSQLIVAVREYDSEITSGVRAVSTTSGQSGADPAAVFVTQNRAIGLTDVSPAYATSINWDLTTTYAVYVGTYVPTPTCRWASIVIDSANNGAAVGDVQVEWCILRNKATVGARSGTNLLNSSGEVIDDNVITNFDDATAMGFNPAFALWPSGQTFPENWSNYGNGSSIISKETSVKQTGPSSVEMVATGVNGGMFSERPMNFSVDSIVVGSVDIWVDSGRTGGAAGILVDLPAGNSSRYYRETVNANMSADFADGWQRVYFKAAANSSVLSGSGDTPTFFDGIRIYVMASYSGMSGGVGTGLVRFDNLRFAILSPEVDNEAQVWANIAGTTNAPEDNATNNTGALADLDTVDTPQIENQAVNLPEYQITTTDISVNNTAWVTVQTLTSLPTGGKATVLNFQSSAFIDPSTTGSNNLDFRILRDGAQIAIMQAVAGASLGNPTFANPSFIYIDEATTGTHTYTLQCRKDSATGGNYILRNRAWLATVLKDN